MKWLAACVLVAAGSATAAPMFTDFATIRAQVQDVVIGTVHRTENGLTINVDTVVKGNASAGEVLPVKDAPHERANVDHERVLAFVDKAGQLRWVGQLAKGPDLEAGVLSLHGFFDFNAHLVNPGIVTLALETGALVQRYMGPLTFPDARGVLRPSQQQLTVQYDPLAHEGAVLGPAPACLSAVSVRGVEWQGLRVAFSDTCPSTASTRTRSLRLAGRMTGVDAQTGALLAEFIPVEPYLSEVDFHRFSDDASLASVTRVISVTLNDGSRWAWRVGEGLVTPAGKLLAPGGYSSGVLESGASVETTSFVGASITLSPAPPSEGLDSDADLIHAVQTGAITSCRFGRAGRPQVRCTLAMAPSIWRKR